MSKREESYDDDDGRTIADMSGLGKHPMLGSLFIRIPPDEHRREAAKRSRGENTASEESEPLVLTRKERRYVIFGAMGAGLLIGAIFIGALIALLALVLWLW